MILGSPHRRVQSRQIIRRLGGEVGDEGMVSAARRLTFRMEKPRRLPWWSTRSMSGVV